MGGLGDQVRGVVTSAALYTVLPDQVNQAHQALGDALPEDMKAVIGIAAVATSVAVNALREGKQE